MRRNKLLKTILTISLIPFLCGCFNSMNKEDYSLGDVAYSFENGNAIINFKATKYKAFNLYEKPYGSSSFTLLKTFSGNSFSTENYRSSFKVVPLINKKENNEQILEIKSYFDGVFDNPNIKIFSPEDDHNKIQNYISLNYQRLRTDEWSKDRLEMLFLPGDYEDVTISLGYYMSARGLGLSPDDNSFKSLSVKDHPLTGNALINFWRSLENLSFKEASHWAVSQATSIRRSHFQENLYLFDAGASSGGFISNSVLDKDVNPGSQQQFLMRNDTFNRWTHSNMNMVFEGSVGEMPEVQPNESKTTIIENSFDVIEKPYLVFDSQRGFGFIFSKLKRDSRGHEWSNETDYFVSLSDFYVFHPGDSADKINAVLKTHQYTLFTPGIYDLDKTIEVVLDNSFMTGLGYATLSSSENMNKLMSVKSKHNIICSLLLQNNANIDNFLVIEENDSVEEHTLLSDLFFRAGGQSENDTSIDTAFVANQDKIIGDNFWIWRADHGKNIGFTKNYAKSGCQINGQDIIWHALLVEHFYEYQTIWNGENGTLVFYQSETPYDLPDQSYWMKDDEALSEEEKLGFASYKVNNDVMNHKGYGIGIYYVNTSKKKEQCYTALECPNNEGIYFEHVSALHFVGEGGFIHTINNIDGNIHEDNELSKDVPHFPL